MSLAPSPAPRHAVSKDAMRGSAAAPRAPRTPSPEGPRQRQGVGLRGDGKRHQRALRVRAAQAHLHRLRKGVSTMKKDRRHVFLRGMFVHAPLWHEHVKMRVWRVVRPLGTQAAPSHHVRAVREAFRGCQPIRASVTRGRTARCGVGAGRGAARSGRVSYSQCLAAFSRQVPPVTRALASTPLSITSARFRPLPPPLPLSVLTLVSASALPLFQPGGRADRPPRRRWPHGSAACPGMKRSPPGGAARAPEASRGPK